MSEGVLSKGLVLAVHPTSRGFGWVVFEGQFAPVDWGTASAKAGRNARLLARFERLLARYEPTAVVFEQFEEHPARRGTRTRDLCRAMIHLAHCQGANVPVYSRTVVRICFASMGAVTRYEIAQAIALHIPVFRKRLPPAREPWMSEDRRQSLFDAAALAIAHYAVGRAS